MESDSSAICSDVSVGKLRELLRLESKSHRDTGQCYDTLQKEYDDLLRKYAEAENTIDKLRIDTLRERIAKKEGEEDPPEIFVSTSNIWKGLYDDLLGRTTKLQNAVTEFQEHLAKHESAGDELNEIFDRLNTDFENITNAFRSMQALENKVFNPNEKYSEETFIADDLEGNLYRVGLRLEEIQDEIDSRLRSTLKGGNSTLTEQNLMDALKNISESPTLMQNIRENYERDFSETETSNGEDGFESDVADELRFDESRPVTDDLSEMAFYKNQKDKDFLGMDPIYLSRSFSLNNLPRKGVVNLPPSEYLGDVSKEEDELDNRNETSQKSPKNVNAKTRRRSPTVALRQLNLKKSSLPSDKGINTLSTSLPNALTSPEDSGYLEGSQPTRCGFPSRRPISPLPESNINEEMEFYQNLEESAGEQYRQRLDLLRDYIRAKRAINNSSSLSTLGNIDRRPRNIPRNKKNSNLSYRNSAHTSPTMGKQNSAPKLIDPESSTTDSVFSGVTRQVDDDVMNNQSPKNESGVQKQDIDTLRSEMRDMKDLVLDLKDSLRSRSRLPSKIPIADKNISNVRDSTLTDNELSKVHQLQNKQVVMLENLESKLDDIADKMQDSTILNQQQTPSRNSTNVATDRLDSSRHTNRSPHERLGTSHLTNLPPNGASRHTSRSPYDTEHRESLGREVDDIVYHDVDGANVNAHDVSLERVGTELRDSSCNITGRGKPANTNNNIPQTHCRCKNCQNLNENVVSSHDNFITKRHNYDNCVSSRNDNECHNPSCLHSPIYSNRTSRNHTPLSNQHGGGISSNEQLEETKTPPRRRGENNADVSESVKCYHGKLMDIGEEIDRISSRMLERKEKENERSRDEMLEKQEIILKSLEDKLLGLSMKIEENEKKSTANVEPLSASQVPIYMTSCPGHGYAAAHQNGPYLVNAHSVPQPSNITNPIQPIRQNLSAGHSNTAPQIINNAPRPNTSFRSDDATWMYSTPKDEYYPHISRESPEKLTSSNVYHHYHSVYSPPREELSRHTNADNSFGPLNVNAGVNNPIIANHVQDSLKKASVAALHMETLSKKMLHGIANDLFNSGPSEF